MSRISGRKSFGYIKQSKFVRSIAVQLIAIFMIAMIAVTAVVLFSFTGEIKKSIISERRVQLDTIENTITKRLQEVTGIAYSLSNDSAFYLEAVIEDKYSGYEMSKTLERYLAGNAFIKYLAYYRLSEPDTIYVSSGELSLSDFWTTYMHLDAEDAKERTKQIQETKEPVVVALDFGSDENSYFAYTCPLPQFSQNPKAFIIMLIPFSEITPTINAQLSNCTGKIAFYDASGREVYQQSNLEDDIVLDLSDPRTEYKFSSGGEEYIVQKTVSQSNGWTYASVLSMSDLISGNAGSQLAIIIAMLAFMVIAIILMLVTIIKKYRPINDLAMSLRGEVDEGRNKSVIDEESLLSDTFAVLKDDSEQKQKYEAAFYEAEAANKAKSSFLSNMSHDIRTPMNAIVGMTEIAYNHVEEPEYVKECLNKVKVSSHYLLDIINNVLDMSRIESGNFTLSRDEVELPKLIYGINTILTQNLRLKNQKFIIEVGNIINEKVIGDNIRITQVFMNILSNSVKFTPDGGTIKLYLDQVHSDQYGYGKYVFVFSDTGIGMSPEFTEQVFDTFSRDKKTNISKIEGTGLGMAIAKNFVNLMGGQITCESELGKGTKFTVVLNLRLAEDKTDYMIKPEYKNKSVLILGEDKNVCLEQSRIFEKFAVKAEIAHNAETVATMTRQSVANGKLYDFVIINQSRTDKSGIAAMKHISSVIGPDTPMKYVLAANDILSIEQSKAVDCGMSVFVQTPFFRSTVVGILSGELGCQDTINHHEIVNLEGKRVLLVEDNEMNRDIAHTLISDTNAEIVDAENGLRAVEEFRNHEAWYFDIILMDVQMPIMNGYEATAEIRSTPRVDAANIPIYAMTANTFDEDVRQVRESGMNGHLGKPYVPAELFRVLEKATRTKGKE